MLWARVCIYMCVRMCRCEETTAKYLEFLVPFNTQHLAYQSVFLVV